MIPYKDIEREARLRVIAELRLMAKTEQFASQRRTLERAISRLSLRRDTVEIAKVEAQDG